MPIRPLPRGLTVLAIWLAPAFTALLAGPASAATIAQLAGELSIRWVSATYQDDGGDASGFEGVGSGTLVGSLEPGTPGSSSGTFRVNGAAPADPLAFAFGVGDVIEVEAATYALASRLGSPTSASQVGVWEIRFEDFDPRNIVLTFEWSYSYAGTLSNTHAGNTALVSFEAGSFITNYHSSSLGEIEVRDIYHEDVGTIAPSRSMSGGFQLVVDKLGGEQPWSLWYLGVSVASSSTIWVPEPGLSTLLASLSALGIAAAARRREPLG